MVAKRKMDGVDRRRSILDAARPLFAERGFAATHMREVARAAGISEALIYRHFNDKRALYNEVLDYSPHYSRIALSEIIEIRKERGETEAIVATVYVLIKHALINVPGRNQFNRLFLYSLVEDAGFAKENLKDRKREWSALWAEWVEKATDAGDLVPMPGSVWNRWLFAIIVEVMLVSFHLSEGEVFECDDKKDLIEEFTVYCLRAVGMTDPAIKKYFRRNKLESHFRRIVQAIPRPYD